MVVHKQRVDICNKTLIGSDHWGTESATYNLKTVKVTCPHGPQGKIQYPQAVTV